MRTEVEYTFFLKVRYLWYCLMFLVLLGAFAKLRKVTISVVISVCRSVRPSVRTHGTTRPPPNGYSLNLTFEYFFEKSVKKIQVSLKSNKEYGTHYMKTNVHFRSYFAQFFL